MNGIPCPSCGAQTSDVIDSRATGTAIRRRRVCDRGHRFTTYERIDATDKLAQIQVSMNAVAAKIEETITAFNKAQELIEQAVETKA